MVSNRDSTAAGTYTVGQVAELAQVSVRTLHHYDQIGLVTPTRRSEAGYRLYTRGDLERLQQVFFYRALGFALEDIRAILDAPEFDRIRALHEQRSLLQSEGARLRAMLEAVDAAIAAHQGGYAMSDEEMFEVFGTFNPEAHQPEVQARWGETDAYRQSAARASQHRKEDWLEIKAEADQIGRAFIEAMEQGHPSNSRAAMLVAELHRQHIVRWFYECSLTMHRGLGEMQVQDERFAATWDAMKPGLSRYVSEAFTANADAGGVSA